MSMHARKMTVFVLSALLALVAMPAMADDTCPVPQVETLWAGQTTDIGTVTVSNDDENLYVKYQTTGDWYLTEVHLYVLDMAPTERLPPGQAPYKETFPDGTQSYTFTVPLDDAACGETLWLQAHAAVVKIVDGHVVKEETAYGGDITKPSRGAWYGNIAYEVQCCEEPPPPPGECKEETAWGGASEGEGPAWWYYYDNNGGATQPIYAGQKLTDGTVTCSDNGQLSIDLGSWSLQDVDEPVKVQCYEEGELPDSRPNPGPFDTFKGDAVNIPNVCNDECRYIAIHLDVEMDCE
jgi:hypothetical protein